MSHVNQQKNCRCFQTEQETTRAIEELKLKGVTLRWRDLNIKQKIKMMWQALSQRETGSGKQRRPNKGK